MGISVFPLCSCSSQAKQMPSKLATATDNRPLGRSRISWLKTIQQDLKSKNLSLDEAVDRVRIDHSGDCCLRLVPKTK